MKHKFVLFAFSFFYTLFSHGVFAGATIKKPCEREFEKDLTQQIVLNLLQHLVYVVGAVTPEELLATGLEKAKLTQLIQDSTKLRTSQRLALTKTFSQLGEFSEALSQRLVSSVETWQNDFKRRNGLQRNAIIETKKVIQITPMSPPSLFETRLVASPPFTLEGRTFRIEEKHPFPYPNFARILYSDGSAEDFNKSAINFKFSKNGFGAFDAKVFEFESHSYLLTSTAESLDYWYAKIELWRSDIEKPLLSYSFNRQSIPAKLETILLTKEGELFVEHSSGESFVKRINLKKLSHDGLHYSNDKTFCSFPVLTKEGTVLYGGLNKQRSGYSLKFFNRNRTEIYNSPLIEGITSVETGVFHVQAEQHDILLTYAERRNSVQTFMQGVIVKRIQSSRQVSNNGRLFSIQVPEFYNDFIDEDVKHASFYADERLLLVIVSKAGIAVVDPFENQFLLQHTFDLKREFIRKIEVLKDESGQISLLVTDKDQEHAFTMYGPASSLTE